MVKCLTISQPFATLIQDGSKFIENRKWPTKHRGQLAIHAGKGTQYLDKEELQDYPTGCVIAVARLVACVSLDGLRQKAHGPDRENYIPGSSKTWREAFEHPHAEGPWCWILEDVRTIEQFPIPGKQGLWDVTLPVASSF